MKHTYTINDGLRTVGQLLLHRPAVGSYAYDKYGNMVSEYGPWANSFCYAGAIRVVADKLSLTPKDLFSAAMNTIDCGGPYAWDGASETERMAYAATLAAVTEP